MAVTRVGVVEVAAATSGTTSFTLPTVQDNDVFFCLIHREATTAITPPGGEGYSSDTLDTTTGQSVQVFWTTLTSGDSAASHAFTHGSVWRQGQGIVLRGVDTAAPLAVADPANATVGTDTSTETPSETSSTVAGAWAIWWASSFADATKTFPATADGNSVTREYGSSANNLGMGRAEYTSVSSLSSITITQGASPTRWQSKVILASPPAPTNTGAILIAAPALAGTGTVTNPPSFVAAGTPSFTATNGATLAPGLPAGFAADDMHILVAARSDNTAMTDLTGSGWTQINAANNTAAQRVEVWARRAVGGDSAPTITFGSGTIVRGAQIFGFRGVPTGVPLTSLQLSRSDNAASATITFATITPTNGTNTLLAVYAYEDDPSAASQITDWTTFTVSTSALGSDMAIGRATRTWSPANSATGALTSTASGGTFANSVNVGIIVSLPAVVFSITGTGDTAIGIPALAASGTYTPPPITGTGDTTIGIPAVAGTGSFATTGTGAVSIGVPVLDGTGSFATTGTGELSIAAPVLDGTGSFATTGTGDTAIGAPVLDGTGTYTAPPIDGTGDTSIATPALDAVGTFTTTGTGAVSLVAPVLDGSGTAVDPGTGSGSITIAGPAVAGSGTFTTTGSGDTTIGAPVLDAVGTFTTTGSGAVSLGVPVLDGTGSAADPGTGSGAISLDGPALAGSGTFTPEAITGTGAVSVAGPQLAGTGSFATTGSGAASIGPPVLDGTGTFTILTITGTAEITISAPGLAGTGTLAYVGTGAITIGAPILSGYSILATRAAASSAAYTAAVASDAATVGATAGDLALVGAASSNSEV